MLHCHHIMWPGMWLKLHVCHAAVSGLLCQLLCQRKAQKDAGQTSTNTKKIKTTTRKTNTGLVSKINMIQLYHGFHDTAQSSLWLSDSLFIIEVNDWLSPKPLGWQLNSTHFILCEFVTVIVGVGGSQPSPGLTVLHKSEQMADSV